MGLNYGIGFCRRGIEALERQEDAMFEEKGHGFDKFSQENLQLMKYKELLKRFKREKELELSPSYDPEKHGTDRE